MNNLWRDPARRLELVHRIGAVAFALGIGIFGALGLANRLEPFSVTGSPVLGLSSNGLLSTISLVVAVLLIAAAVRGGRTASTVLTAVGGAFLLSGLVNVLLIGGPYNLLAFRISNVIFSLVAGGLLLILGSWGRFTGRLPADNPYAEGRTDGRRESEYLPTVFGDPADAQAARELAEAERAVAQRVATPSQLADVAAVRQIRRLEDRVRAWRVARR